MTRHFSKLGMILIIASLIIDFTDGFGDIQDTF